MATTRFCGAALAVLAGTLMAPLSPLRAQPAAAAPGMAPTATRLVLPQNRGAFYSDEPIQLAIAGLPAGATSTVEFIPQKAGPSSLTFTVKGDGTTTSVVLPGYSLAPNTYTIRLDGRDGGAVTITTGVNESSMFLSQTQGWEQVRASGGNFAVSNAFTFGEVGPDGLPLKTSRGRHSQGQNAFERAIVQNLPSLVYMYWTGFVTHKPWGSEKSWAEATMVDTMRLFNLHTAQRIRRYNRNILSVGTLDEPGLSWGKTPAGGMASGFPNWDEAPWYEARGWKFSSDIAAESDADWIKYMTIRCGIMKENQNNARLDLKSIWPEMVFSTDLYAPSAIMDGTDPLNQEVNDIPSSHVFMDWGIGKPGVIGAIYLEKAHNPSAKLAHAMNGQLFSPAVPQPQQRDAYRVMLNGMLAAGLHSNWWLNMAGMKPPDLAAVNEPGLRYGPLFQEMTPEGKPHPSSGTALPGVATPSANADGHDVALLWSFTEAAMRQKEMAAKESTKKTGEQIKLMIAALPENSALKDKDLAINAYSIGGNYKEQILTAHQALSRAGYPAHIVHEKLLPRGILKPYKTLVIVGQTFALPADVQKAIADFTAAGGRVVVDGTTTVKFNGAVVTTANFKDPAYRWTPLFLQDEKTFKTPKEASYFKTNFFMDQPARDAVPSIKQAMAGTKSQPVFTSDSAFLCGERHLGGEGQMLLVLNANEALPEVADDKRYGIYNYAPLTTNFKLRGIKPGSEVYVIEGADWSKVSKVEDPQAVQTATFEPGEMKIYLVAPRAPEPLQGSTRVQAGALELSVASRLKMPWPLTVTVTAPDGNALYRCYRALDATGTYRESFPLGLNASAGNYVVTVENPVDKLKLTFNNNVAPGAAAPRGVVGAVQVFDETATRKLLRSKPTIVIATGSDAQTAAANQLASALTKIGAKASVAPEKTVWRKARYPRVWDPFIKVYVPQGEEKTPEGYDPKITVDLHTGDEAVAVAQTADGKDLGDSWRKPNTLATVTGDGFIDYSYEHFYEPGCKIYIDAKSRLVVIKGQATQVQATDEVRRKWSRPWSRLSSYVGTDRLVPQLPEAYSVDTHLILLGDSTGSELVAALQASDLLTQVADANYPGPGKALLSYAWSPFGLGKDVILVGASDDAGIAAGINHLLQITAGR